MMAWNMTDKRRRTEKRQPINRLVAPETVRLLKSLAAELRISEGRVLDRAVAALAVAESFGGEHLRLSTPIETAKLCEVKHTARFEPNHIDEAARKRGQQFEAMYTARRDDEDD